MPIYPKFKGRVTGFDALPEDAEEGDFYIVNSLQPGPVYAEWIGGQWTFTTVKPAPHPEKPLTPIQQFWKEHHGIVIVVAIYSAVAFPLYVLTNDPALATFCGVLAMLAPICYFLCEWRKK